MSDASPAFFGYHATCWRPWPEGWVGCPEQEVITVEPVPASLQPLGAASPAATDDLPSIEEVPNEEMPIEEMPIEEMPIDKAKEPYSEGSAEEMDDVSDNDSTESLREGNTARDPTRMSGAEGSLEREPVLPSTLSSTTRPRAESPDLPERRPSSLPHEEGDTEDTIIPRPADIDPELEPNGLDSTVAAAMCEQEAMARVHAISRSETGAAGSPNAQSTMVRPASAEAVPHQWRNIIYHVKRVFRRPETTEAGS